MLTRDKMFFFSINFFTAAAAAYLRIFRFVSASWYWFAERYSRTFHLMDERHLTYCAICGWRPPPFAPPTATQVPRPQESPQKSADKRLNIFKQFT